jgi:hypothetical protein
MSENKRDYAVGRGKPPVHTRFKKGQSGNPRGPDPKNLPALLIEALDEPVMATIDGEQRSIRSIVARQPRHRGTRSASGRARRRRCDPTLHQRRAKSQFAAVSGRPLD